MATKKKTTTAKNETVKKDKAAAPKPKREKVDTSDLVTFAVRLPKAEAAALHAAAGPRNASRFTKMLFAAFVAEDSKAFDAVVKEASEARR